MPQNEQLSLRVWETVEAVHLLLGSAIEQRAESRFFEALSLLSQVLQHLSAWPSTLDPDTRRGLQFRNQRSPSTGCSAANTTAGGGGIVEGWFREVNQPPATRKEERQQGASGTRTSQPSPTAPWQARNDSVPATTSVPGSSGRTSVRSGIGSASNAGYPYTMPYRPVGLYAAYPPAGGYRYHLLPVASMSVDMGPWNFGPYVDVVQHMPSIRFHNHLQQRGMVTPAPFVPYVSDALYTMQQVAIPTSAEHPTTVQEPSMPMQHRAAPAVAGPSGVVIHGKLKRKHSAAAVAEPRYVGEQYPTKQKRVDVDQQGMPDCSGPVSADAEPVYADLPGAEEQVVPMEQSAVSTVEVSLYTAEQQLANQLLEISTVSAGPEDVVGEDVNCDPEAGGGAPPKNVTNDVTESQEQDGDPQ